MSRIGNQPVQIPSGVNVEIVDGVVKVNGSKGSLEQEILLNIKVSTKDEQVVVSRNDDQKVSKSNHGLQRALIQNMVEGVSKGFEKKLEVNGVGFKVALSGNVLNLSLGLSHPVQYILPEGIVAEVKQNNITISGHSKQAVGQVAAEIRALKKPEPYKGKGIQYAGERIIRKSGKSGKE